MPQERIVVRKLEAIIAACKYGISAVARVFVVTDTTLRSCIKRFHGDQTERLKAPPSRRRRQESEYCNDVPRT
ncbi:MAG: hypothetical protein LBP41_00070 [Holosporaceae bacterium]|nr:hypothetical protein [Holosporaceae bacterium]